MENTTTSSTNYNWQFKPPHHTPIARFLLSFIINTCSKIILAGIIVVVIIKALWRRTALSQFIHLSALSTAIQSGVSLILFGLIIAYIIIVPWKRYRLAGWELASDSLYVRQGGIIRENIVIAITDISHAAIFRTIGDLCVGTYRLKVTTLSIGETVYLWCENKKFAEDTRDTINCNALPTPESSQSTTALFDTGQEVVRAPWSWIRFSGATMGGFYSFLFAILFTITGYNAHNALGKHIVKMTAKPEERYGTAGKWLVLLAMSLLLGLILANLAYSFFYINFTLLENSNTGFMTRRGFIFHRTRKLPKSQIYGCELTQTIFLRLANGARVYALLRGKIRAALLPPGTLYAACSTGAYIINEKTNIFTIDLYHAPPISLRRRQIRIIVPAWIACIIIAGIIMKYSYNLDALAFPVIFGYAAWWIAQDGHHNLGYGYTSHHFITQAGSLHLRRFAVAREKILGWKFRQTPWQYHDGLCTLRALTAIGLKNFKIIDIFEEDAMEVMHGCLPWMIHQFLIPHPYKKHPLHKKITPLANDSSHPFSLDQSRDNINAIEK